MNKVKKQPDLARDGLGGLMLRYSLPCVISLLVAALYNIVDQIFIANATISRLIRKRRQYGGVSR